MNSLTAAQQRYTCKAYDATQRLSEAQIEQLLEVLRLTPSSVNSQPWQFLVAATEAAKARIINAMPEPYHYNAVKVRDASHTIVLCARTTLDEAYLQQLLAQDELNGRFANEKAKQATDSTRRYYVEEYRQQGVIQSWAEKQVYLALGQLLLAAGIDGIDATPMEGFDAEALNAELDLTAHGLSAVVVVALGVRSAEDPNYQVPKSRLPKADVVRYL